MVIPIEIVMLTEEAVSHHNDGWTQQAARERLQAKVDWFEFWIDVPALPAITERRTEEWKQIRDYVNMRLGEKGAEV